MLQRSREVSRANPKSAIQHVRFPFTKILRDLRSLCTMVGLLVVGGTWWVVGGEWVEGGRWVGGRGWGVVGWVVGGWLA